MTAKAGRKVLVYYTPPGSTEEVAVGALKSKSVKLNKELIDITTDDSTGWRELLDDTAGTRSVDLDLEGIIKDRTLLERWDNEEFLTLRIVFPGTTTAGIQFSGSFAFASAELGADMEDAATFSYSFQSSGVIATAQVSA